MLPPTATAGTVQIRSCADAPAGGLDTAWQVVDEGTGGYEVPAVVCPPTGTIVGSDPDHGQILGRSIWTKLMSGVAVPAGANGEVRFAAPPGTAITGASVKRDLGKRDDGYLLYGKTDDGTVLDSTCAIPGGQAACSIGGFGAGYAPFSGLNAQWIAWGFECGDLGYSTCSTGATLYSAWAHLYGAVVTLTDNQNPTSVTAGGDVTTGGWKGGTVAGTISGSDNLGVQKVRWYADGALVSTSVDRACDFSVTVPCSDATNVGHGFDTTGLSDGVHSVEAAVVDPAGNEAKGSAFSVNVDNAAPAAPTALDVTGGGSSTAIAMSWSNPAADGGSAYVSSRWEACSGATCSSGTGGLTSASGSLPNVTGSYTVKVWLVDGVGNATPASAASDSVSYTAPPPPSGGGGGGGGGSAPTQTTPGEPTVPGGPAPTTPAPPIGPAPSPTPTPTPAPSPRVDAAIHLTTPRLDRRTGKLTLRGTLARGATGTVSITLTTSGHRQTAKARIRRGRYASTIQLPKGTERVRVTVRYRGSQTTRPGRMTRTVTTG